MEEIANLFHGFAVVIQPFNLLLMVVGILLGVIIGVLPGLGGANGVAILLPLTFGMSPTSAIIMLSCIYWGALFGGAITSVVSVVIPTTIYVFAVPWTGIYLASLILIAVFMKWLGRYNIAMCAAVAVSVTVATYLMFEKWFLVPLPKGPIEDFFGL